MEDGKEVEDEKEGAGQEIAVVHVTSLHFVESFADETVRDDVEAATAIADVFIADVFIADVFIADVFIAEAASGVTACLVLEEDEALDPTE